MRLRSKTRFRIVLALALCGPLAWTLICGTPKPSGTSWPWPPGLAPASRWTVKDEKFIHNTTTGQTLPNDGSADHWEEPKDGGPLVHTKSTLTLLNEGEAQSAWMFRLIIFTVGLILTFIAAYIAAWVGMLIAAKLFGLDGGSRRHAARH